MRVSTGRGQRIQSFDSFLQMHAISLFQLLNVPSSSLMVSLHADTPLPYSLVVLIYQSVL
jgi:hypothetical protein